MRKLKLTKKLADEFEFCDNVKPYLGAVLTDNQWENFKLLKKYVDKIVEASCGKDCCGYERLNLESNVRYAIYSLNPNVLTIPYDDIFFLAGELADAVGVYLSRKGK